ncbi:hypothetical protein LINPERHAP1_LOCUS18326, partial [Linum perenne]
HRILGGGWRQFIGTKVEGDGPSCLFQEVQGLFCYSRKMSSPSAFSINLWVWLEVLQEGFVWQCCLGASIGDSEFQP